MCAREMKIFIRKPVIPDWTLKQLLLRCKNLRVLWATNQKHSALLFILQLAMGNTYWRFLYARNIPYKKNSSLPSWPKNVVTTTMFLKGDLTLLGIKQPAWGYSTRKSWRTQSHVDLFWALSCSCHQPVWAASPSHDREVEIIPPSSSCLYQICPLFTSWHQETVLTPSTEEGVKIFLKLEIISHIIQMCKNKMPNASSSSLAECGLDNLLQALVKHSLGSPTLNF